MRTHQRADVSLPTCRTRTSTGASGQPSGSAAVPDPDLRGFIRRKPVHLAVLARRVAGGSDVRLRPRLEHEDRPEVVIPPGPLCDVFGPFRPDRPRIEHAFSTEPLLFEECFGPVA